MSHAYQSRHPGPRAGIQLLSGAGFKVSWTLKQVQGDEGAISLEGSVG
jgi:hypothetical protein